MGNPGSRFGLREEVDDCERPGGTAGHIDSCSLACLGGHALQYIGIEVLFGVVLELRVAEAHLGVVEFLVLCDTLDFLCDFLAGFLGACVDVGVTSFKYNYLPSSECSHTGGEALPCEF